MDMRIFLIIAVGIIMSSPLSGSMTASSVTFSVSASASPAHIASERTVEFAATVVADGAVADYGIGLQVFLGKTYRPELSQVFTGVTFQRSKAVTRRSSWTVPAGTIPGNYTLLAGVFDAAGNWQTGEATSFVVGRTGRPGLSISLSTSPPYTCLTNYYVDAVSGRDANPGTQAAPWKTIQNADNGYPNRPTPGECINVLPGTYQISKPIIFAHDGNSNTRTGYVVYRSTVPQKARILAAKALGGSGDMIMLWAPYIIVDGFEIDGNDSIASGAGIDGCADGGGNSLIAHHFVAINNIIHDMGGAGLSSCTADYITWAHNVIYNTSSTNRYQVSGIDLWEPKALAAGSYTPTAADNRPFGIVIAYNIARNNGEGPAIPAPHTDGNGIIIDTTSGSATCPTCGTAYPGNILVLGNLAYDNGGGGIHVFLSENVIVASNTGYNNYLDSLNPGTARGELSNGGSQNITWVNNLAVALPGSGVLANNRPIVTFPVGRFPDSGTWTKNIAFGASVTSTPASYVNPATNLIGVNPQLANPAGGNFVPLAASPALKAGQAESYIPSPAPNIGAY
jgi:hypothetical protein